MAYIVTMMLACNYTDPEKRDNIGIPIAQDVMQSSEIIPMTDSAKTLGTIQIANITKVELEEIWPLHGYSGAFIACNSEEICITATGENFHTGVSSFSWQGVPAWSIPDSVVLGNGSAYRNIGSSPAFGISLVDSLLTFAYWGQIVVMNVNNKSIVSHTYFNDSSSLYETLFKPLSVSKIGGKSVVTWAFPFVTTESLIPVVSVLDDDFVSLWDIVFSREQDEYKLVREARSGEVITLMTLDDTYLMHIAASDSAIYLNPARMDVIIEFDIEGNVISIIYGDHSRESYNHKNYRDSAQMRRQSMHLVRHIEYIGNDVLAVLYGTACFPTDSSEIWCVNLSTGAHMVLPFSKSVSTFSATSDRLVIAAVESTVLDDSTSMQNRTIETMEWSIEKLWQQEHTP